MTGKANTKKDIVDVIKKQKRDLKRAAGVARATASGVSSSSGVISGATNQSSGAGTRDPTGGDLFMHTYDIKDVDRLYFATTAGSGDSLTATDTGIESASYYDGSSYINFGLRYQVPGSVSGVAHSFRVGSIEVLDMDINNIQFNRPLNLHSNTATGSYINGDMYYDGTDIKAVVPAGTVNLTSGTGGWVGTATSNLDMAGYSIQFDTDNDTYMVSSVDDYLQTMVGGSVRMSITNSAIDFHLDLDMNDYDIQNIDILDFKVTGQRFNSTNTSIQYEVPTGDVHKFLVSSVSKVTIDSDGLNVITGDLDMAYGTAINFNSSVATSRTGGAAASLPSNPVGYILIKFSGSFGYIPYYS